MARTLKELGLFQMHLIVDLCKTVRDYTYTYTRISYDGLDAMTFFYEIGNDGAIVVNLLDVAGGYRTSAAIDETAPQPH